MRFSFLTSFFFILLLSLINIKLFAENSSRFNVSTLSDESFGNKIRENLATLRIAQQYIDVVEKKAERDKKRIFVAGSCALAVTVVSVVSESYWPISVIPLCFLACAEKFYKKNENIQIGNHIIQIVNFMCPYVTEIGRRGISNQDTEEFFQLLYALCEYLTHHNIPLSALS